MTPIWDELSKKITVTGQNAVKGMSNLASITRLRDSIAQEQRNVSNFYLRLGQECFRQCKDIEEEPYAALCARIKEGEARIAALENEIQMLQDMKKCPQCGAVCKYDSHFCPSCGAELTVASPPSGQDLCQSCGATLVEGALFCKVCGTKVES
jgi:RNA polymerase subunit RPABC4/transcription elongation factor Spt4